MRSLVLTAIVLCSCVSIVAAGGASSSNHGASSRERQNTQMQKAEAYARNRELLASAKS